MLVLRLGKREFYADFELMRLRICYKGLKAIFCLRMWI
jgi:hypothetical protein